MLYEYKCDNCDFVDSYFHKMNETPEIICPECNNKMRKVLGLNYKVNCDGFYSSKTSSSNVKKITQTVMGVEENNLDKIDNRIKDKAAKAKPIAPC